MPDINVLDHSDEDQLKEAALTEDFRRKREIDALTEVLDTYNGRLTIWRIIEYCGLQNVAPFDLDELQRFEGRRDVGAWVRHEVFTSDLGADILMRTEAQKRDYDFTQGSEGSG